MGAAHDASVNEAPVAAGESFAAGSRLRIRWAAWEPWVVCRVVDTRVFAEDVVVQHRLSIEDAGVHGSEDGAEWVDLAEVAAFELVQA